MSAVKCMNHPNKTQLIDFKYKLRLRASDVNEVIIRQRTLKGASGKRVSAPSIDVVKTPSLIKKELEKEKAILEAKVKKGKDQPTGRD